MTEQYRDYKREAYERYVNGLDNPIGSVMEFDDSVGRSKNKYAADLLDRHAGQFLPDNPVLKHLAVATNKQDVDALYERAVNYDINYAILQEQRDYDLPENEIQRQREAGINVDLTGSGSGSGGIGSGNAQMHPVEGQTKFSNSYDNTQLVFEGLNTVANMASTFTGFVNAYTSIVGVMDMLATQHSRINLSDAQANLSNAQANEINELLAGKKAGKSLSNAGQAVENSNAVLGHLANLSQLLSADSTDESILSSIKSLGLSEDEGVLGNYKDIVKSFHKNPEMQKKFFNDSLGVRQVKERYEQFDEGFIAELVAFEKREARAQASWDANYVELQNRVAKMLNNEDYATDLADLEQSITGNANVSADIQGELLQAEFDSLALKLDEISAEADRVQGMIDDIKSNPKGMKGRDGKTALTPMQEQRIRQLEIQKARLLSSGSEKYEQCFDMIDEIHRTAATYFAYGGKTGTPTRPSAGLGAYNQETFMSIYTRRASVGEVVRGMANTAIQASGFYLAGRGMGKVAGKATKTIDTNPNPLVGVNGQPLVNSTYTFTQGF